MGEGIDGRELLPELGRLAGHVVWRARARVTGALAESLPPRVDIHAYAALLALAGGAPRSQQAVSEMISVSPTTMTKVAHDLAEQGLVDRVRNDDDRRSWALTRTPEGAAAARRWRRHADRVEESVSAGFTPAERADLRASLLKVAASSLDQDAPDALRESIPFLITRVHQQMHAAFLAALQPVGIEPSHVGTLVALETVGPVPQHRLAHLLGVSGPHVVQIVDGLEARDLVERRRSTLDRRAQEIHLAAAAAPTLERARGLAVEQADLALQTLSASERDRLMELLRRVVTAS